MSVRVLSWVLDRSRVRHRGDLLVLIVLADHAHDDGSSAYPSVETIAGKARLTRRGAQLALRRLEDLGAIEKTGAKGPHGTVAYRIVMGEVTSQRTHFAGEVSDAQGRSERRAGANSPSPEPSLTTQNRPTPPAPRKRGERTSPDSLREQLAGGTDRAVVATAMPWPPSSPQLRTSGSPPSNLSPTTARSTGRRSAPSSNGP